MFFSVYRPKLIGIWIVYLSKDVSTVSDSTIIYTASIPFSLKKKSSNGNWIASHRNSIVFYFSRKYCGHIRNWLSQWGWFETSTKKFDWPNDVPFPLMYLNAYQNPNTHHFKPRNNNGKTNPLFLPEHIGRVFHHSQFSIVISFVFEWTIMNWIRHQKNVASQMEEKFLMLETLVENRNNRELSAWFVCTSNFLVAIIVDCFIIDLNLFTSHSLQQFRPSIFSLFCFPFNSNELVQNIMKISTESDDNESEILLLCALRRCSWFSSKKASVIYLSRPHEQTDMNEEIKKRNLQFSKFFVQ